MPRINITEHSDTYSFQVRNNSYACIALPICAIWGPAYVANDDDANPDWVHFEAGYRGTTDFINTFKGPNTYMGQREKSYDYALKLLASGYDILVKRADGIGAVATAEVSKGINIIFRVKAKYPGSYGNQLKVRIKVANSFANGKIASIEIYDRNGHISADTRTVMQPTDKLIEIKTVALDTASATDSIPYIHECTFEYLESIKIETANASQIIVGAEFIDSLIGGYDYNNNPPLDTSSTKEAEIKAMIQARLGTNYSSVSFYNYIVDMIGDPSASTPVPAKVSADEVVQIWNQQRVINNAWSMFSELTDPICYDWDCVFLATRDDQYIPKSWIAEQVASNSTYVPTYAVTQLQLDLAKIAAQSKCGCAFNGEPFNMPRGSADTVATGAVAYKDQLSAKLTDVYSTYAELVGPWCKTTLPINGTDSWICPEMAHLLLIINAQGIGGINKWWMVPAGMTSTGVVHTPEYKIKKAYLDMIQNHDEGVCLNPLMEVPGKGFTCFGNSTLWNKPLGTYNALQNLSTRLLCNRVKQRIWDVALQILFKYNNENAYSHFYAGLSPLLDEMRSVGALTGNEYNPLGYQIIMNPDIINLDKINANTVIGKVYLAVTGVIDTVDVDLFLLPPTGFMETYD